MKKVSVLNSPSAHSLKECLQELKFGRRAADQKIIDKWIAELDNNQA